MWSLHFMHPSFFLPRELWSCDMFLHGPAQEMKGIIKQWPVPECLEQTSPVDWPLVQKNYVPRDLFARWGCPWRQGRDGIITASNSYHPPEQPLTHPNAAPRPHPCAAQPMLSKEQLLIFHSRACSWVYMCLWGEASRLLPHTCTPLHAQLPCQQ